MKTKIIIACILLCAIASAQTNYVLNFNGNSNYVNLGSNAGSSIRSIEFWFRPSVNITSSLGNTNVLIGRNDATESREYGFYIQGSEYPPANRGKMTFYIADNGIYYYVTSDNNSWAAGTWYHVCGTIDAVSGMKIYINGAQQTDTDPYTTAIPAASEITALGRWGDLAIRHFSGKMDEVRFWNRTLSQSEIQQKKCYWLNPANETGLTGYWKMNEGSGLTIVDTGSGGNNGTISGATFVQDSVCFSEPIGTNEIADEPQHSIFPNPFSGTATLKAGKNLANATLTIYNSLGQQVKQLKNISGEEIEIQREGLPCGVYLIFMAEGNNAVLSEKLIVTDN